MISISQNQNKVAFIFPNMFNSNRSKSWIPLKLVHLIHFFLPGGGGIDERSGQGGSTGGHGLRVFPRKIEICLVMFNGIAMKH
jgi:hypothetical protein